MLKEFYEDCEIFVTGGSGVVGKALIELLLRACNVRRIYMLMRPKKGLNVEQRLEKICNAKIFRRLRASKPQELQKLVIIPGDAVLPELGITAEYAKMLERVSIFFHCAATVRFDEPLKVALRLNVAGTLEALKFAETLKHLKMFMHVSTFYSNPYLTYVEPKVYEPPMDWRICLQLLESDITDDAVNFVTRKLITGFPNTYTFTKNLAESLVNDYRNRLPVVIFRPSVVIFALNDPEPGYPPSLMGAMGLFAVVGAGVVKTVYLDASVSLDLSPQDVCVKTMLYYVQSAAAEYAKGKVSAVPVYIASSRQLLPHKFKAVGELMDREKLWIEGAFEKCFMIPGCIYTSCGFYYMFLVFFKQLLPALLADGLLRLFGQKPVVVGIGRKAYIALHEMRAFLFNDYDSPGYTDYDNLIKMTTGTDFEMHRESESAATYEGLRAICGKMVPKIREILMKEDPATLQKQQKVMRIKIVVYNVIRAILAYYVLRWLCRVVCSWYH